MKHKNLQPWIDYFQMLRTYEEKSYLEIQPEKHEAYVTRAALLTLAPGDVLTENIGDGSLADTIRRIRAYAAFKAMQGENYLSENFALHVVKEKPPHDLLSTIVLTPKRHWWQRDKIEVIDYREHPFVVTPKQSPPAPPEK